MVAVAGMRVIRGAFVLAGAALLVMTPPGGSAYSVAQGRTGPESVADLAEGLLDAVVNISITQSVKSEGDNGTPLGDVPDGAPFEDLFNDFFKGKDKNKDDKGRKVSSLGSGFVIDPEGYIVTNNHVIDGGEDIEVNFANGTKLKASLVGVDPKTDIALLKVEPKAPLKAVAFGDSRKMRIGDWVMAIGNPFGLGGSVSVGIVSARNRNINAGPYDNFIQTDAAINRGNSGGPLFNMNGEVIGINTAIISPSGGSIGIGFSVPTEIAAHVVRQLREFGEARRGWLGVRIQPVTEDMIAEIGLDRVRGAMISGVIAGGPADNDVIMTGDVILSFNDQEVTEMRDLPRIVAESPIGVPLVAKLIRGGEEMVVTVTLVRLENETADKADEQTDPEAATNDEEANPEDQPEDATPQADDQQDKGSDIAATDSLGLSLAALDDEQRKTFGISVDVEGVVITEVAVGSQAEAKGIVKGDVIVEVAQTFVQSPEDVTAKIAELKQSDRRNAFMMIANGKGDLRLVAVPLD